MTRILAVFWILLLGLGALWVAADPVLLGVHPFKELQQPLIQVTGILAMGAMSVAMLLALRSVSVEPYVGGLDKSYRLHKWLGVTALVMALAHWLLISAPGLFGGATERRGRGAARFVPPGPSWLRALQGPAKGVGSWALWGTVILVVLALLRWFPYRWFLRTHRLLALVFLLLVFHAAVLLKLAYWKHSVAYVLALLMVAAVMAALYILVRRVGRTRQAVGEITNVTSHQDGQVLGVEVCLKDRWPGHEPGQFAFATFDAAEGPHPFTISSRWNDDGRLVFLIKGLGDYTRALPLSLRTGSLVTVEGPYGRFNFRGARERQIWVSAGIGITPFISRMQELAANPDLRAVDLYHATADRNTHEVKQLRRLAAASRIRLHVWVGKEQGRLTAPKIMEELPDWRSADVWFCGPVVFGKELRKEFAHAGLPSSAFHQELFHLR
ncbi:MAG TPA: ferric reductase-like transmembrane domain-containing protein [Gemmatimonadaceae bacterium]|nr:ferric reductase-like transmembrane domain-containing protein [Gemmatimonadaceae bacterium]